jgi:hypothetical protein
MRNEDVCTTYDVANQWAQYILACDQVCDEGVQHAYIGEQEIINASCYIWKYFHGLTWGELCYRLYDGIIWKQIVAGKSDVKPKPAYRDDNAKLA